MLDQNRGTWGGHFAKTSAKAEQHFSDFPEGSAASGAMQLRAESASRQACAPGTTFLRCFATSSAETISSSQAPCMAETIATFRDERVSRSISLR